MKYQLVIFDWDGTLMDSGARIVSAMQSAAQLSGLVKPEQQAVRDIIGLSLDVAVAKLFADASGAVHQQVYHHYKDQYVNHDQTPSPLFDGAQLLLKNLKQQGYRLAVATGKGRNGLNRVWQQTNTGSWFDGSRCADEAQSKPSPDMLIQLLEEFKLAPEQALMIGDTEYDMAMAQAIEMDRIGVSFGVHHSSRLLPYQPLTVIDSLKELHDWL